MSNSIAMPHTHGGCAATLHQTNNQGAFCDGDHRAPGPRPTPNYAEMMRYVEAGLQLIPLQCWDKKDLQGRPRGKVPADQAWQRREYLNSEVIERSKKAGMNVGMRLPPNVVVIDVDPRNFPEDRNSLAELVDTFGLDLSTAPHTFTGSGGHHYYFRKDTGVVLFDSLKAFPGIEFKSEGRQVVAAGSVHPCGAHYTWDGDSPPLTQMPELPANVLSATSRPKHVKTNREAGECQRHPESA